MSKHSFAQQMKCEMISSYGRSLHFKEQNDLNEAVKTLDGFFHLLFQMSYSCVCFVK